MACLTWKRRGSTGAIIATGAKFRSLLIKDTVAFASATDRLRLYSVNLEHAQTEANGEIANSSFVDIYSLKGEGNTPMLWIRASARNVSVLGFGGDPTAFPYNFTQPPDFAQLSPSMFRVERGARGVSLAMLLDHGFGTGVCGGYHAWCPGDPTGSLGQPVHSGECVWGHHYPYPGEAVAEYPFGTCCS